MSTTTIETTALPSPSKAHATCAWCGRGFPTIVDLIDHVDRHITARDALAS